MARAPRTIDELLQEIRINAGGTPGRDAAKAELDAELTKLLAGELGQLSQDVHSAKDILGQRLEALGCELAALRDATTAAAKASSEQADALVRWTRRYVVATVDDRCPYACVLALSDLADSASASAGRSAADVRAPASAPAWSASAGDWRPVERLTDAIERGESVEGRLRQRQKELSDVLAKLAETALLRPNREAFTDGLKTVRSFMRGDVVVEETATERGVRRRVRNAVAESEARGYREALRRSASTGWS